MATAGQFYSSLVPILEFSCSIEYEFTPIFIDFNGLNDFIVNNKIVTLFTIFRSPGLLQGDRIKFYHPEKGQEAEIL